eukprot:scaffold168864_cov29-Tisochrysis_lutea.AAC.4
MLDDGNLVGIAYRAQTVSNRHSRSLLRRHDLVKRSLHHALTLRVKRRRRLVEQQHRRPADDGARDGDPLLLAARQAAAARFERRVVACRQAADEVVRIGGTRGLLHVGLTCALAAVGDIVGNRACEENGLLPDEAELPAQPAHVELAQVDAVEQHDALEWVVEALDERDGRRFSAARRAAQCDHLAGGDLERVAVADEPLGRRRVGEYDAAQLDVPLDRERDGALGRVGVNRNMPPDSGEQRHEGAAGGHDDVEVLKKHVELAHRQVDGEQRVDDVAERVGTREEGAARCDQLFHPAGARLRKEVEHVGVACDRCGRRASEHEGDKRARCVGAR